MLKNLNHDKTFFTADQHFAHANIIEFCDRPYKTIEEMDEQLIANWNAVVGYHDTVIHLGDFCLGETKMARYYFEKLNGNIHILGLNWHHDKRWLKFNNIFRSGNGEMVTILPPEYVLNIDTGNEYPLGIHLSHYPMGEWDRKHYGGIHLHGHSHGNYHGDRHHTSERCWDVGVDGRTTNYSPVSLSEVLGWL